MNPLLILIVYFVLINGLCLLLFGLDKQKAKNRHNRISERMLWFVAFAGGSIGGLIGMKVFRHKTKKVSFKIGMPLIGFIHIFIAIYAILYLS